MRSNSALFTALVLFVFPNISHARYLGSCVDLLSESRSVGVLQNPDAGTRHAQPQEGNLSVIGSYLKANKISAIVREGRIELSTEKGNQSRAAQMIFRLQNDPSFKTTNYPDGVRVVVDFKLEDSDGEFSVTDGEIKLASAIFRDPALVDATLAHELTHAEKLSKWFNSGDEVSALNTTAEGVLPGLENTFHKHNVSALEMPAYGLGMLTYQKASSELPGHSGAAHLEMNAAGKVIARSFQAMSEEILSVIDNLSDDRVQSLLVTNYTTLRANGISLLVEYHIGFYTNVKSRHAYIDVKVLKNSNNRFKEYHLRVPVRTKSTRMTGLEFYQALISQLRALKVYSAEYSTKVFGAPQS